jgi:uncharacterized protein YyaL (SSP411 family)
MFDFSFRILIVSILFIFSASCRQTNKSSEQAKSNHLINETSAYLLEHAHNPVDWYPWGEEALNKVRNDAKLLIISIGYSSCHWCHVMERESFSDTTVSRLMNQYFVSVKVDREERPDLDNIYMTACQLASRSGACGWPLNVIALSDGKPVWVGSYLQKEEWIKLLNQVRELYREDPNELQKMAYQIANHLQTDHKFTEGAKNEFELKTLSGLHERISKDLDFKSGGRQGAPKFPIPVLLQYEMEYAAITGDQQSKNWIKTSLDQMMHGGIYDQLSGGFARYSTDDRWHIPHFEKMLYDNAQLLSIYAAAYKLYKSEEYKNLITKTIAFMQSDFSDGQSFYYASIDADSEGEEGKYYAWTQQEIKQILNDEQSFAIFSEMYDVTSSGNWEHGKNVLWVRNSIDALAKKFNIPAVEITAKLEDARNKLLQHRKTRKAPHLDQKVLTAWNALMIDGLSDAYAALGDEKYFELAMKTGNFLKSEMMSADYRMYRTYKAGKKGDYAFLDDYAFTIKAFIKLYEISFDETWLKTAKALTDYAIQNFSDEEQVYFYYNSSKDPALIARKKEIDDQVIPASNSVMCDNLHRLGLYFYDKNYLQRSSNMLSAMMAGPASSYPTYHSNWLRVYLSYSKALFEVAVVGPGYKKLHKDLLSQYLPQSILMGGATEGSLELLKEKLQEGQTFIYVCRNKVCKLPVKESAAAIQLMK